MDKLILVLYVDITNVQEENINAHVQQVSKTLFTEDVIQKLDATTFVIPRLGGGTTIESLNPKFVLDKNVYNDYESKMKTLNDNLEQFISDNGK